MDGQRQATFNENMHRKNIKQSADELLDESKKFVNDMYDDGLKKMDAVQKEAQVYTDEWLEKIRENPLKSVLIAGGLGLLLSMMMKK